MAEKDVTEKILMSYADVFADCINTLVYDGERLLNPADTQPAPVTGDTRFTEQANKLLEKKKGNKIMMCEYINQLEARGEARGKADGEVMLATLLERLYDLGRGEEVERAVRDLDARARLYKELSIPGYTYEP